MEVEREEYEEKCYQFSSEFRLFDSFFLIPVDEIGVSSMAILKEKRVEFPQSTVTEKPKFSLHTAKNMNLNGRGPLGFCWAHIVIGPM